MKSGNNHDLMMIVHIIFLHCSLIQVGWEGGRLGIGVLNLHMTLLSLKTTRMLKHVPVRGRHFRARRAINRASKGQFQSHQ